MDAPSIDVLKIDTEGADTWVLEGAEGFLREKKIRHIFFEEHKGRTEKLGIPLGNATAYLLAMGYSVFRMDGGVESRVCEYHAFI